ncbi:hypothetical protein B0J14DRAFT_662790 [Halenospora varia]|nr:hypothetical protein B0J14DRAFT_662790 [Halenospora varia]
MASYDRRNSTSSNATDVGDHTDNDPSGSETGSRSKRTRNQETKKPWYSYPAGPEAVDDLKKDQHHQALGFSSGEYPSTNTRTSNQNTTTAVSKGSGSKVKDQMRNSAKDNTIRKNETNPVFSTASSVATVLKWAAILRQEQMCGPWKQVDFPTRMRNNGAKFFERKKENLKPRSIATIREAYRMNIETIQCRKMKKVTAEIVEMMDMKYMKGPAPRQAPQNRAQPAPQQQNQRSNNYLRASELEITDQKFVNRVLMDVPASAQWSWGQQPNTGGQRQPGNPPPGVTGYMDELGDILDPITGAHPQNNRRPVNVNVSVPVTIASSSSGQIHNPQIQREAARENTSDGRSSSSEARTRGGRRNVDSNENRGQQEQASQDPQVPQSGMNSGRDPRPMRAPNESGYRAMDPNNPSQYLPESQPLIGAYTPAQQGEHRGEEGGRLRRKQPRQPGPEAGFDGEDKATRDTNRGGKDGNHR